MAVISCISLAPESLLQGEHFKALEKQLNQTWVSDYRTNASSALLNSRRKPVGFFERRGTEKKMVEEKPKQRRRERLRERERV